MFSNCKHQYVWVMPSYKIFTAGSSVAKNYAIDMKSNRALYHAIICTNCGQIAQNPAYRDRPIIALSKAKVKLIINQAEDMAAKYCIQPKLSKDDFKNQ